MAKAQSKNIERNCFMIMHTASSGDQFGVNFNFNYVLLQIRETSEDFEGARMKLKIEDVDESRTKARSLRLLQWTYLS